MNECTTKLLDSQQATSITANDAYTKGEVQPARVIEYSNKTIAEAATVITVALSFIPFPWAGWL